MGDNRIMSEPNKRYNQLKKQSARKLDKLVSSRTMNKYGAKGQFYGGSHYDSTGERDYAIELDFRKKANDIKDWRRQVKIEMKVNGVFIFNYFMDFIIEHNNGTFELVEYKGAVTPLWQAKWNLLHALKDELYPGATITLVKHKTKYNPWKQSKK
jgi:hypothetical protein